MSYLTTLPHITTLIFDVDGVLTNGNVTLMPNGEMVRTMNIKDSYALQLAIKRGYRIAIITGGSSQIVKEKLEFLGIKDIFLRSHNKLDVFNEYLLTEQITAAEVMYMGDDLPDYEVMSKVGLAACPADAAPEIKRIAHFIATQQGGLGCVREVVETILKAQQKWEGEDMSW